MRTRASQSPSAALAARPARPARPARRRDRHGRGMRGSLLPRQAPLARTRAERFDDLVLDAVEVLDKRWGRELAAVDFAVEEVPQVDPAGWTPGEVAADPQVPLSRCVTGGKDARARVVIYRRPVETRAGGGEELGSLVYRVVVEEVANLLGLEPERIDPSMDEDGGQDTL